MATKNIIGRDLEENQQQQLPTTLIRCTLTTVFEQVSATVLTPSNFF